MAASLPFAKLAALPSIEWQDFTSQLTQILPVVAVNEFLIITRKATPYYVQFCTLPRWVRMEAVSNHHLGETERLAESARLMLLADGWRAPTHEPDRPGHDSTGSSNYFADHYYAEFEYAQLATLASRALRNVYSVASPSELEFKVGLLGGRARLLPELRIPPFHSDCG